MEHEDQNVQLVEYALQYYNVMKLMKYETSSMWSILYQCNSEKFPHIFLMIELCLSATHSNKIVERFFCLIKVVKSDWHSKLKENIEALIHIKVEGPKIE